MASALHVYQTWIEYNDDPAYHPITVSLREGTGNGAATVAEFSGNKLSALLRKVQAHVIDTAREDGMIS